MCTTYPEDAGARNPGGTETTGRDVEAPQSRLSWRGVCLPPRAITQNANHARGRILVRRDVTNVVKPPRFSRGFSAPCYKRRQSEPEIGIFWRFSPQIDDVCNMRGRRRIENAAD